MLAVPSDLFEGRLDCCGCCCWCCCCCCGCIAWQVQHYVQRALAAFSGLMFFLSFFAFLPRCFCDCPDGGTPRSSSALCCSQVWSIFNPDPPRISPTHHVPFRCMDCLVCSTGGLCLELLDPIHESRLLVDFRPHAVMILITLSFLRPFLCLLHSSFPFSLFSEPLFLVFFSLPSLLFTLALHSSPALFLALLWRSSSFLSRSLTSSSFSSFLLFLSSCSSSPLFSPSSLFPCAFTTLSCSS